MNFRKKTLKKAAVRVEAMIEASRISNFTGTASHNNGTVPNPFRFPAGGVSGSHTSLTELVDLHRRSGSGSRTRSNHQPFQNRCDQCRATLRVTFFGNKCIFQRMAQSYINRVHIETV